jgi:hypothetical protein
MTDEPLNGQKFPAAHGDGMRERVGQKYPGSQIFGILVLGGQKYPAGHPIAAEVPFDGQYVPAIHGI